VISVRDRQTDKFAMDVAEIGDVGEERGLLDFEMSCCACVGKRGNIRRSSAALEWDEAQQKVVAQRMQVGLSIHQLSLSAVQESSSCYNKRTGLVDTIVVPEELAELKDLTSILSLEVYTLLACFIQSFPPYPCIP
jgi:hypothetical protein